MHCGPTSADGAGGGVLGPAGGGGALRRVAGLGGAAQAADREAACAEAAVAGITCAGLGGGDESVDTDTADGVEGRAHERGLGHRFRLHPLPLHTALQNDALQLQLVPDGTHALTQELLEHVGADPDEGIEAHLLRNRNEAMDAPDIFMGKRRKGRSRV